MLGQQPCATGQIKQTAVSRAGHAAEEQGCLTGKQKSPGLRLAGICCDPVVGAEHEKQGCQKLEEEFLDLRLCAPKAVLADEMEHKEQSHRQIEPPNRLHSAQMQNAGQNESRSCQYTKHAAGDGDRLIFPGQLLDGGGQNADGSRAGANQSGAGRLKYGFSRVGLGIQAAQGQNRQGQRG